MISLNVLQVQRQRQSGAAAQQRLLQVRTAAGSGCCGSPSRSRRHPRVAAEGAESCLLGDARISYGRHTRLHCLHSTPMNTEDTPID